MQRLPLILFTSLLAGCDLIGELAGYTNPTVMAATFLGVEAPDAELVDLTGTSFEGGAVATVLLADAADLQDVASAAIVGAKVELSLDGADWRSFRDDADGKYILDEGLDYRAGMAVSIRVRDEGGEHGAELAAPGALDVELAPELEAGSDMVIRTEAQDISLLGVVVLATDSGEVVFDNRPISIEDVYDLTHGGGSRAIEVPGVVFSRPGGYIVGVAGLAVSRESDLDNLNTTISALTVGTIRFYPVLVRGLEGEE